jgi:hypothetical protein
MGSGFGSTIGRPLSSHGRPRRPRTNPSAKGPVQARQLEHAALDPAAALLSNCQAHQLERAALDPPAAPRSRLALRLPDDLRRATSAMAMPRQDVSVERKAIYVRWRSCSDDRRPHPRQCRCRRSLPAGKQYTSAGDYAATRAALSRGEVRPGPRSWAALMWLAVRVGDASPSDGPAPRSLVVQRWRGIPVGHCPLERTATRRSLCCVWDSVTVSGTRSAGIPPTSRDDTSRRGLRQMRSSTTTGISRAVIFASSW